ncbi:sulfatase [Saccharobesus litoralis]|uniref:Sulfatase n=2 Tax=Saccharobesus litoralis TaxID=2172099 RepID=A0A2S0VXC6_9ALTE|nr:sulfatase [Saccharobesus litoralis]
MLFVSLVHAAEAPRPNILFILTDDQGYADVGFNGSPDIITPNLDKLAENGTIFTSAYVVHPFCGPSRAGLMTGRYPHKFGSQFNLPSKYGMSGGLGIDVKETFISKVLQDAGYYTGAIGKWHLGETAEFHPNNRGFDEFYGFLNGGHVYFPEKFQKVWKQGRERGQYHSIWHYMKPLEYNGQDVQENEYVTDGLSREAVKFIEKAGKKDEPFFLYLAYNAPHTPLEAKEEDMAMFPNIKDKKRKTYAGMVYAVDRGVKRIVQSLKDTGQYDNTMIVFLSDNGGRPDQGANNYPLQEGKGSVLEGGYRTPMFIHWPKGLHGGNKYKHPVSALDFYPTFANLAGAKVPEHKKLDGKDIWPAVVRNKSARAGENIYVMRHWAGKSDVAVRRDNIKAVKLKHGAWQMYDVDNDPGETQNIVEQNRFLLQELVAEFEIWSWTNVQPQWFYTHNEGATWRKHGMPRFDQTFKIAPIKN